MQDSHSFQISDLAFCNQAAFEITYTEMYVLVSALILFSVGIGLSNLMLKNWVLILLLWNINFYFKTDPQLLYYFLMIQFRTKSIGIPLDYFDKEI